MAIAASAVWRVRVAGNDLNGACYDGSSYAGGTDYTQQDAAQATFTATLSTSAANSTTLLNSANTFTAAMVGNAINLASGTNAIAGFYFITAFASAGSVTLDRTPATAGALAGGTGRLGGALASIVTYADVNKAVGNRYAPGNTIYVRGSGSTNPTTPDYSYGAYTTAVSGDQTAGRITFRSENGRACIGHIGMWLFQSPFICVRGLKFIQQTATWTNQAVVNSYGLAAIDCIFDQAGFDATQISLKGSVVSQCEFMNSGTATAGTQAVLVNVNWGSCVSNNIFHGLRGPVATLGNADTFINNLVLNNLSDGVLASPSQSTTDMMTTIAGNTFDGNAGHGIAIGNNANFTQLAIFNNLITNHTGVGKAGISATGGTLTSNTSMLSLLDFNSFFNNTTNTSATLTVGAGSTVGVDPGYISRSTEDVRIGTALKAVGLGGFKNSAAGKVSVTSYVDPGAVQRQESSASSSVLRRPSLNGVG